MTCTYQRIDAAVSAEGVRCQRSASKLLAKPIRYELMEEIRRRRELACARALQSRLVEVLWKYVCQERPPNSPKRQ